MIKKALWALALLLIASGCNDDKSYDSPPRNERLVKTTFNFKYLLDYDTPSAPAAALTQAPAMPEESSFRVVLELYEWIEVASEDPNAEPQYEIQYYDTKAYYTDKHVLGADGKLTFSGKLEVPKGKFTAVVWGDYSRSIRPTADRFFGTNSTWNGDYNRSKLRYVVSPLAVREKLYDTALSGTKTFDFSVYEDEPNAYVSIDVDMTRALGKFTLVANDLQQYKNSIVSPNTYETTMRPTTVVIDYGTQSEEHPLAGYRYSYDGLKQTVATVQNDQLIGKSPLLETSDKIVLCTEYLFARPDNSDQEMMITILGPMGLVINKFYISVPIVRNQEIVIEDSFLVGQFEGTDGGFDVDDDFEGSATEDVDIVTPLP